MSVRHLYEYKFLFVGGKIKNGVGQTCIVVSYFLNVFLRGPLLTMKNNHGSLHPPHT